MRSRDAWLAVFAATLGVSEEACKREVKDAPAAVHDVPSASASVAASAPSASSEPVASATASAAPSASSASKRDLTEVQAKELAKLLTQNAHAACGASISTLQAVCGAPVGTIGRIGNNSCGASSQRPSSNTGPTANVVANASGGIAGDDRVVAMMRPRLRSCANQALKQNPNEQGKIVVTVTIASNGEVTATTVAQNSGLSEASAQCMARSVRTAKFPESSASRTIHVTITQTRND